MNTAQPIVIVGMHRSGTSMLAELLHESGLFLGWKTQPDHREAYFFQKLNDWVLREASATWDRPEGIDSLLADQKASDYVADYLQHTVQSPRTIEFLGPKKYASYRSLTRATEPWGWKDPRTTLTFPLWHRAFPNGKVLHVTRHGVDVARSLQVRYDKELTAYIARYRKRRLLYSVMDRRTNLNTSIRVADMADGIELWDTYVTKARAIVDSFPGETLEFRFEDLLADPDPIMERLLAFCGLPASTTWADRVDVNRAFAFRKDDDLVAVAKQHADTLAKHGYEV